MLNKTLWDNISDYIRQNRGVLGIVSILSVLTYFPFFAGDMYNADSFTYGVFSHSDQYGWENNQGRFLLRFLDQWRDGMILPPLIIGICLFFLLASVIVMWNIFDFHSPVSKVLSGIVLVCTPSMADLFTYYYTADHYCFAFCLAMLAALLMVKGKRWISACVATALLVVTLSVYQVYLCVTVTVCGFWLLMKLLDGETSVKTLLHQALRCLIAGIAGVGIYWIIFTALDKMKYLTKTSDRGADGAVINAITNLGGSMKQIYQVFAQFFFSDAIVYNSWHGRKYSNGLIVVLIVLAFALLVYQRKVYTSTLRLVLSIVLLLLVPVMTGIVILMVPDVNVYAETGVLVLGGMYLLYVLLIILAEQMTERKIRIVLTVPIAYTALLFCIFIGVFARMEQAESAKFQMLAYGMETRLETLEDYHSGMKVCVVGRPQSGNYPFVDDTYKTITKGMISDYSLTFGRADQVSNSWIMLFRYYCGVNYEAVTDEEREEILASEELQEMEIYPAGSSVQRIGEIAVIRLSE